ncbi:unnamed protein product [Paramecium primaurelia]|uniref:Uncharacterized protein n=1 Tax=Paramecium primaurelia TaxID=5886 RepID=A0A8S1LY69_PARPR|nr:unnamed protein product [Paramecium primaurelia]
MNSDQRFITQNSQFMSRRSQYLLQLQNDQLQRHRTTLNNLPDQEELINQLNAKQEKNNQLQEDIRKLKTLVEQKERDIKNYEALVQKIENTQNFDLFVKEGKQLNITRSMAINLKRKAGEDKQEIQKQKETIKELQENIKTRNVMRLKNYNVSLLQDIQIRNDIINGQNLKIQELNQQIDSLRIYQNYYTIQQDLPGIEIRFNQLQNNINELINIKRQTQADLDIVKIQYQFIKQQTQNNQQRTRYRSGSFNISQQSEIQVIRDQRSKSISKDNILIERNWQLIKSLENKNNQLIQKRQQQCNEIITLKNQINDISKEKQVQENLVQQLKQNAKDNADRIKQLQNDLQVINLQNANLKQLIQNHGSDLTEKKLQIVQQKEIIEKLNQELLNKDKNKEIEQLKLQINQEIEKKNNNQQIYNQQIEQLNAILNEKKQDNDQLNNNLRHLNSQIQELKQQNEDYNNKNLEYNQIINNLKLEINNIQANLDIKDQNILQLTQNIEQLNLEIQQLNKDKESLIQDKDQFNEEIQSLNQNINQLNQDKELLNKDKELFNQEIQQLNQHKKQLNENIQQLIQHQEQLNQEIIQKDDNIQDLKIELQIYEYSSKKISINVANQNQNKIFQVQLKDSSLKRILNIIKQKYYFISAIQKQENFII